MRNIRLMIEYDGTAFHGWQRQTALRTVQGELETALAVLLREPVTVRGAGRTDAGVHALAQAASFRTASPLPLSRVLRGVNALTGADVCAWQADEVASDFDARHSARARHYVYLLLARPSAHWAGRAWQAGPWPDGERMNRAVAALVGEHDFAAFSCAAADEKDTRTRVCYARWESWDRGLALRIGAVRFLYRMVRCIVAGCVQIGCGRGEPGIFRAALEAPAQRGRLVAPARGLHLAGVDYEMDGRAGALDCLPPPLVL